MFQTEMHMKSMPIVLAVDSHRPTHRGTAGGAAAVAFADILAARDTSPPPAHRRIVPGRRRPRALRGPRWRPAPRPAAAWDEPPTSLLLDHTTLEMTHS